MKTHRVFSLILLYSILQGSLFGQSTLFRLSFDGIITGDDGEQPSLYNYNTPLEFRNGIIDQAAFFPVGNQLQYLADQNINDLTGTIHFWINTAWYSPGEYCLFYYGNDSNYMKIRLSTDNIFQFIFYHSRRQMEAGISIDNWEPDTWHHIALTWNSRAVNSADAIQIFFDGALSGINESGESGDFIQSIGGEFQIGGERDQFPLEASLDQFTITDFAMSNEEIKALFEEHIPVETSNCILLDFENNLLGNNNEEPTENNATSFVQGKFGQALRFNPQNTLIYGFEENINPKRGVLSCWVSPNWTGNPNHILFQIDDGTKFSIGSDENGDFKFKIGDPATADAFYEAEFETSLLSQQSWTHLAFVWNYRANTSENAIIIYINGDIIANNNTNAPAWNMPSIEGETIQICGSGLQNTFSGVIDRFFILDNVPDQDYIMKLMNGYYPVIENMHFFSNTNINLLPGNFLLPDKDEPGAIRINDIENLNLDGSGFSSSGSNETGVFLFMENCSNIVLSNFESISNYFLGIKLINCSNIQINNCTASNNKSNTEGLINIDEGPDEANGGGICLENCSSCSLSGNTINNQNDGMAIYSCHDISINENNCSNNSAAGIRLYHSDDNHIDNNICTNNHRDTGQSDCAAVLLYFCSNNTLTNNDFSYCDNGIYFNDNKTLANARQNFNGGYNSCINNDCSYATLNAIESVFSLGNTFQNNTCSFSQYGFWMAYSHETTINNNTINHNKSAGIAIDRGYSNLIDANIIRENYIGSSIWQDDSPLSGYTDFESADYDLSRNYYIGNNTALQMANTNRSYIHQNLFITNMYAIRIDESAINDTITNNRFSNTVAYNFYNMTNDEIIATGNSYGTNDESVISCKIYEENNPGTIIWNPYAPVTDPEIQTAPPSDLSEKDAEWISFTADGELALVSWDSDQVIAGNESVKLISESGAMTYLNYTPGDLIQAGWDLSNVKEIVFSIKINKTSGEELQTNIITLSNECLDQVIFTNPNAVVFNQCQVWTEIRIPISGNDDWIRTGVNETLDHITFIRIELDTWGHGFELWLDNLHFEYITGTDIKQAESFTIGNIFPNPGTNSITLPVTIPENYPFNSSIQLTIRDMLGRQINEVALPNSAPGLRHITLPTNNLKAGYYIMEVSGLFGKKSKGFIIK